ncbi:glycosyltransferase family 4 protein [Streptomyces sp. NPDC002574]|uniref:glycosyltransferase family 4 protein n=1 Tax=Streptomyces sp. NPDC002574 TaxID=3364652 RepID=UPI0036779C01
MHIAIFVENRNGVDLAGKIMQAEGAGEHTFSVITADLEGNVARWIRDEAAVRLGGIPARNLFNEGEALDDGAFYEELSLRVVAFVEEKGVDRVVLFNDQSQRGKRVTQALNPRLPVVLVQDGHLDFHYKEQRAGQRDQNWYYGSSAPAAICVWGPATYNHINFRSSQVSTQVHITGALGHSDDAALLQAARSGIHRPPTSDDSRLRFIVLDQPLGDQRKLSVREHRLHLKEICEALTAYGDVDVKPHPSSLPQHLKWLETLPDVTVQSAEALLDAAALQSYDLAVTYFSTTYLQTLRAGVPLVLVNPLPLNIVFPTIHHPLLRSVGSAGELTDVVSRLKSTGKFLANTHGEPIEHYLTFSEDVAEQILRVVENAELPAPVSTVASGAEEASRGESGGAAQLTLAERAFLAVQKRADRPKSLAVLGAGFSYVTGVAVPVLTYTQSLLAESPVDVRYFDIAAFTRPDDLAAALGGAEVIMVNSLALFWRSPIGNATVQALIDSGRNVALYAHETEYVFNWEANRVPERHQEMLNILPKLKVLCVSKAQADMFRQLGVVDPIVVYNTVPRDSHRKIASRTPSASPRIVMVGTVQDRKGVDLFSRVAEKAHSLGLPWRFSWIGWKTPRVGEKSLLSDRVEWMGALSRDRVREELAASDVFFLSSVDDPMPLSVVEAVQHRLRVATFDRVGSREVLQGVPGYRSFAEYTPEAALEALREVLSDEVSEAGYQEVEELFDIPAFTTRMTTALGLQMGGSTVGTAGVGTVAEEAGDSEDGTEEESPFAAALVQQVRFLTEDFVEHFKAGRDEDALRVGAEILRRRQPADVVIGMAEIRARRGEKAAALSLLAALACVGGTRSWAWSEIARVAGLLGPEGRAVYRMARREALRIKLANRAARSGARR